MPITDIGTVPGFIAGLDPTGRYVTTVDEDTVTTYDTVGLAPVAAHVTGAPRLAATTPDGTAVAVLTADWSVELWRAGRRTAAHDTGLAGSAVVARPFSGTDAVAWLTFTPDGAHLLAGLAAPDTGPVRLDLLDATTLERVDSVTGLPGGYPYDGGEIDDWGEGVVLATAGPATVGFAANVGDDPHVLAVAEVVDGRLRLSTRAAGRPYTAQLPGERINGIAVDGAGTLYVVDSDDTVTAFAGRDPEQPPRSVVSGRRLVEEVFGPDSGAACAGPVFVVDGRLALPVVGDPEAEPALVVLVVDAVSGQRVGRLDIPEPWRDGFVEDRLLWLTDGPTTQLARWSIED